MSGLVFDRVTKEYRGAQQYRALRDDLASALLRKRERRPLVRALDNVSLEIQQGESFGLIGPNGAGKTTALKIATRITYPTTGEVRVGGRVGALIEVGTGLHPELTGRENIGLYGRILGFSRKDIARRFDEIVEFAGIGGAIDQPVKQYSSGMSLRLGFALAAHLEPDVLLVDEALAVGDIAFQLRCIERMEELVRSGGTLVLVSHDMAAIERLCTRCARLDSGTVAAEGRAGDVVAEYLRLASANAPTTTVRAEAFEVRAVTVHDATGADVDVVAPGEPLTIRIHYDSHIRLDRPLLSVGLGDPRHGVFANASMLLDAHDSEPIEGPGTIDCAFEHLPLRPRTYEIWIGLRREDHELVLPWHRARLLQVRPTDYSRYAVSVEPHGPPVDFRHAWSQQDGKE